MMMQTDQWSTAHYTGTKVNKVRWLPRYDQIGRASFFTTGTWEEAVPSLSALNERTNAGYVRQQAPEASPH
jgi:hypothetical protein